ncbi:MAG: enolase C-terminal domain-like protein, partial [Chloroflexota bacterium]
KIGALDFDEECALLSDVRQIYSADEIELRLDANGAFSAENVMARLERLAQFDIFALEQPIKPRQQLSLADLCAHSPIPIALDEELIGLKTNEEKKALLEAVRPHYLVLKPSLLGGFAAAEQWIKLAESLNIGWWVNSMLESNVGLNAICQWISTFENALTQGLGTGQLYQNNIPSPLRVESAGLVYDSRQSWDVSNINELFKT